MLLGSFLKGDENVPELDMVMIVQVCEYADNHWLVHLKKVNIMVYKLFLQKLMNSGTPTVAIPNFVVSIEKVINSNLWVTGPLMVSNFFLLLTKLKDFFNSSIQD